MKGGNAMATYIMLNRFRQQGMQNIKEAPARREGVRKLMRSMGAEVKQFYTVMGQYDAVVIVEAPDDETIAKAVLAIAVQGNVSTETLRAFTEDEFQKICAALP